MKTVEHWSGVRYLFEKVLQDRGDVMGREVGEVNVILLDLKSLAEL